MAQIVDFRGQELKPPMTFISTAGLYKMKIVKHEVDGYTNEANERHKYTFECKLITVVDGKPQLSDEVYTHTESYNKDEKQGWVFHYLLDAMKAPLLLDPEALVGYYVIGTVEMRKSNTSEKTFANCSPYGYKYSIANDELPPIPEAKEAPKEVPTTYETISADDVPF